MELKRCPICGALVFADMDVCYECMYRFGSDPDREAAVGLAPAANATGGAVEDDNGRDRVVRVGAWDVQLSAVGDLPEGSSLHLVIEPARSQGGPHRASDGG